MVKKKGPKKKKKKARKQKHWSDGMTLADIERDPRFPGYLE